MYSCILTRAAAQGGQHQACWADDNLSRHRGEVGEGVPHVRAVHGALLEGQGGHPEQDRPDEGIGESGREGKKVRQIAEYTSLSLMLDTQS